MTGTKGTEIMKRVLFVCIHNSARSQMAEAFLKQLGGNKFQVESAGIEPGNLNPLVVKAMGEIGIDISNNETNSVFEFLKEKRTYDYVVTVCDEAAGARCPYFPGETTRLKWFFDDPSSFSGTEVEKLAKIREVRDLIKSRVEQFTAKTE